MYLTIDVCQSHIECVPYCIPVILKTCWFYVVSLDFNPQSVWLHIMYGTFPILKEKDSHGRRGEDLYLGIKMLYEMFA